jgi:hypothetical protein
MQTPSLFEQQGKATPVAPAEDLTPRVLSVGVFPDSTRRFAEAAKNESWFAKIKKVLSWNKKKPLERPVQTEWPLDRVTVVRNDLSDSDFDIVVTQTADEAESRRNKAKRLVGRAWKKVEVAVANPEPVDMLK